MIFLLKKDCRQAHPIEGKHRAVVANSDGKHRWSAFFLQCDCRPNASYAQLAAYPAVDYPVAHIYLAVKAVRVRRISWDYASLLCVQQVEQ